MIDLRLNAIVDPERAGGRSLAELTRLVVKGGATLIQLRDKHGSTRAMIEEARAIKAVLAGTGVPLVINDRADVAVAADADGVHVGQEDMRAEDARRLLGPKAIVGLSIRSAAQANAAPLDAIDYAGGAARDRCGAARAEIGVPRVRHRGDRCRQCRAGDRRRR